MIFLVLESKDATERGRGSGGTMIRSEVGPGRGGGADGGGKAPGESLWFLLLLHTSKQETWTT